MTPLHGQQATRFSGLLTLDVVCDPRNKTRVDKLICSFPLRVSAPMYLDDTDTGRMFVCVQNPTAGAFPDDDLFTGVSAGQGARLSIAPQAATQIFAGRGTARHTFAFQVDADAYVEHIAKPLIPHGDSRYHQHTRAQVQAAGVLTLGETIAAGRIAHGELFTFDWLRLDTEIAIDGTVRARDVIRLDPHTLPPNGPGVFGDHRYLSTFTVLAAAADLDRLSSDLNDELRSLAGVMGAVSALPDNIGILVRFLSDRAPAVSAAMDTLSRRTRRTLLGTTSSALRTRL